MELPLNKKLRKREYLNKGILQDQVLDVAYSIEPNAVLHGGTGIWRCLKGNRFSEDLDFYLMPETDFEQKFKHELNKRNLSLLKYKTTENTIFSNISNGLTEVKLEASFQDKKGTLTSYELIDGSFVDVLSLTPQEYFREKLLTYSRRKLVRDLYDVYFLSGLFDLDQKDCELLSNFIKNIEKPVDEDNLNAIILIGAIPNFESMLLRLKRLI